MGNHDAVLRAWSHLQADAAATFAASATMFMRAYARSPQLVAASLTQPLTPQPVPLKPPSTTLQRPVLPLILPFGQRCC